MRGCYRHIGAALVRVSMGAPGSTSTCWPAAGSGVEAWRAWIGQVWAGEGVADAVSVASPVLAGRVEAALGGSLSDTTRVRRVAVSLARYLVRMRGRATPFGLFAGVCCGRFGAPVAARRTGAHEACARADGAWLAGVVARLESCPVLLRRLRVLANDLVVVRGGRLWVPWQPHASDPTRSRPVEVSLRYTAPVAAALHAAGSPVPVADLVGVLAAEFPSVTASVVETMAAELVTHGVLITNLRPPSTVVDGLGHILNALREVNADDVADVAPLVNELAAIHTQIEAARRPEMGARAAVAARMRELDGRAVQPLAVDLRLGCAPVLPPQVAVEAAAAVEALMRLSAAPDGRPAWREYHARFLERLGAGTLVAVTQLVEPAAGLGFPRHDADPASAGRSSRRLGRDERLLAMAQQAALDDVQEIVLDDSTIDAVAGGTSNSRPAAHLDVTVEIRAATTASLEAEDFTLAVTGIGRSAVATTGRFLDLLPDQDRQWITTLPPCVEGALVAQLSFPPHHPRVENVTRVPQVLPAVISLAEHREPAPDRIPLDDLAVTADLDRFYLVSLSRRRVVEPVLACAAAWHTMPPLARLLAEIPHATSAPATLFDWGTAACLPFLPRLRYRRSILAPARWRVSRSALPGPTTGWAQWELAIRQLRESLRLPPWVLVGAADQRLRLHLDDPMALTLLRAHLDAAPDAITITEAPTDADLGWCDGRAHELVIPLASTATPVPPPAVLRRPRPLPVIGREHGLLPSSQVLSAKLYGPADGFDTLLTEYLPALLAYWDTPPVWWFVRYHDPAPHLRLRVRTDAYGRDAERVGAWAAELRQAGLIGELVLDTYRPEIARYGTGAAMTAAQDLFAADSAAAIAQLAATATGRVHSDALTAVSLVDLLAGLLGDRAAGFRWLLDRPHLAGQAGAGDRAVLRQTITLAAADDKGPRLADLPGQAQIVETWRVRRDAASTYAERLAPHGPQPAAVAVSLLHLHHNRAHSADPAAEQRTYKLARAVALAHAARRTNTQAGHR